MRVGLLPVLIASPARVNTLRLKAFDRNGSRSTGGYVINQRHVIAINTVHPKIVELIRQTKDNGDVIKTVGYSVDRGESVLKI